MAGLAPSDSVLQSLPSTSAQRLAVSVDELDQWVSGERLLEILWDPQSRPSLQWLRKETKRRMIPYLRRGRLIFYCPRSVMAWYRQKETKPMSMVSYRNN